MKKVMAYTLVCVLLLGLGAGGILVRRAYAELPSLTPTPSCLEDASIESGASVPPPSNPLVPLRNIVIGDVVDVGETSIVIATEQGQVTAFIGPETRYWKGEWDSQLPIEVGDSIVGYGEPNEEGTSFEMEQLEVNVANVRGPVTSVTRTTTGVDVVIAESYTGIPTLIHIGPDTLVMTESGEATFEKSPTEITVGDGFQIIGLRLKDGSILATRIF